MEISLAGNNTFIVSDVNLLSSTIEKVIDNSVKYKNHDQSSLQINIVEEPHQAIVEFIDNGEGIEENFIPMIFDMFYKANSNSKGSGMGLYIAREAMKRIGGGIEIKSQHGIGTTVKLRIPIVNGFN